MKASSSSAVTRASPVTLSQILYNFSFFPRSPAISSPATLAPYLANSLLRTREEIAAGQLVYHPTTTYMSLIVGDGDNIAFMKGGRRGWMKVTESEIFSQIIF